MKNLLINRALAAKTTKIFTLLLAVVASVGTMFASDTQVDGIWYNFNNGNLTAEVTYQGAEYYSYSDEYSGEVAIPASVTYNNKTYSVTSIGSSAFDGCSGLTSVTIPNSVTSIGNSTFYHCSGLTSVTIPNSVISIGNYAFRDCSSLTSIEIPNSVTSIGSNAFSGCSGLTSVTIPNSVTSIGSGAFSGCTGLTSVTIPSSVTSIGNFAFEGCTGLTSVTIPNSVTSIGSQAFDGCSGLTSVTIPNSVTSIGGGAFSYCAGLTSLSVEAGNTVYDSRNNCNAIIETSSNTLISGCPNTTIPNSVTSIGVGAFLGCTGLTSVTIPSSVTHIGYGAFWDCEGLTSVTIPNSVTFIGDEAFRGCSGLTSLSVEAGNTVYDSRNNCNAIIETSTNTLISGCQNTTIPNSVTSIGRGAFSDCFGLTSVTIGNSVTSIGEYAFYECSGLTSITNYATTPQTIDSYVFYNVNKSACTLNVPKESVSLYQAAEGWKEFTNIVGVDDPDVPSSAPAVYTNPANPAQKLIRNGNVYILTEDKTYTITGQEVK